MTDSKTIAQQMVRRRRVLIIAGVALAALVLLAAGLSQLKLQPGRDVEVELSGGPATGVPLFPVDDLYKILRIIYYIGWVLMPLFIIYLIINKEARKEFLRKMAILVPLLVLLVLGLNWARENLGQETEETPMPQQPVQAFEIPAGEGGDAVSEPPPSVMSAAEITCAVSAGILVLLLLFFVWRGTRRKATPLDQIAEEAQAALADLQSGGDLRNAVIRCYLEMSRILSQERGIQRHRDMTPREFEDELAHKGLPRAPIQELTYLFEIVRYGAQEPGHRQEMQAIACLTAIAEACRRPA
jgi:hypothetical protein